MTSHRRRAAQLSNALAARPAHEARLHPLDLKLLMNHRLPAGGDVTEGYIRPSVEHLRDAIERVAAFLLEKAGAAEQRQRDAG